MNLIIVLIIRTLVSN